MAISLVHLQTNDVSLQRTHDVHAAGSSPGQELQGAGNNEHVIAPDRFAIVFDSWYSRYINDPFILELPLTDIFFHQLLTLVHDFESEKSKEKNVQSYYLEIAKEFYKWRQGDSGAKETLIKILSNFANRMPRLKGEENLNRQHVMAEKEIAVSLWINILKSSSYEKLLLTPKEMKRLYIGKEEDTLGHPLLKKSNFTRLEYNNYLKLLAYNQLRWSCESLSHFFGEFKDDEPMFEKIMYALKEFIPYGENAEWNRYLRIRLERELGFNPNQTTVINDSLRKKMQAFMWEYSKIPDFLSNEVLENQQGFSARSVERFALLYINHHKTLAQDNANGIKKHAEGIRKYCHGPNGNEGVIGAVKTSLELYDSVYNFFLFLESTALEELAQKAPTRNFENEFEACFAAFALSQKDPSLKMNAMQEEVRIIKRYQEADKYPDFLKVRKDVFVPFLRFTKDIGLSAQAVLEASLTRFERLGIKIEVQKAEKPRSHSKESLGNLPAQQAKISSPIPEEKEVSAQASSSRLPQPKISSSIPEKKEVSVQASSKRAIRAPKMHIVIPPVIVSAQQILRGIERKLFEKMDQVKEPLHIFAKERVDNTKIHLMNVIIYLNHLASSQSITKKELYHSVTGLAFEMNLCVEQLLMALVLHSKEAKDLDSISQYRTHDLKEILSNCDEDIKKKYKSFVSNINGMGVFLTDLGLLPPNGLTSLQKMLFNLYQDSRDEEKEIEDYVVGPCKTLAGNFFKFCDDVIASFDPTLKNASIDAENNEWKKHESKATIVRDPILSPYPYQYLFHDVKIHLQRFEGSVHASYLNNIVSNSLSRLEQTMVLLQEKRPRRAFLDFSTIFLLNQVIAEQVLEVCHLVMRGEINHTSYDHNLEKMADDLKDFAFTVTERNFLQKGKDVRQAARYPMSLSLDRGALSSLLEQVLSVSESCPDMEAMLEGMYVVTSRNKKLDYDALEKLIVNDCILLESVLRKILEGCHP